MMETTMDVLASILDLTTSQSVKASTTLLTALPNMEGANGDLKITLAVWQMPANSYLRLNTLFLELQPLTKKK